MIQVEMWSDFVCPFCYLGKREFDNALEASGLKDQVSVQYRAYELQPDGPTEPTKTMLEGHSESSGTPMAQLKQGYTQLIDRAAGLGLEYNFDNLYIQDTLKAHRVAKYADEQGKGKEFQERVFHAIFTENLFLPHTDELVSLAIEIGLDGDAVREIADDPTAYLDVVKQDHIKGSSLGISSVPFFMINEKYAVQGSQPQQAFEDVLKKAAEDSGIKPKL